MSADSKRTPIFTRKLSKSREDAKNAVAALATQPTIPFMKMAKALHTVHDWEEGAEFREVVRSAGISLRKAYHLVKIYEALKKNWNPERFEQIGWTKLCIIAAHVVDRTSPVEQWLKFAESHTARECQLHLEKKPFKNETRCMLLRFDDNQYRAFSKAVLRLGAKKRGKGLVGVERALISAVRKLRQASLL